MFRPSAPARCAPTAAFTCFGLDFLSGAVPSGTFLDVASSTNFSCALATDHTVSCFGAGNYGETLPPTGQFQQLTVGDSFACGLRLDGTVSCWGSTSWDQSTPPGGTFQLISSAANGSCGLRLDGSIACWGKVPTGTIPSGTFRSLALGKDQSSGNENACAIRTDDVVVCWGSKDWSAPTGAP